MDPDGIPSFTVPKEPLDPITKVLRTPEEAFARLKDWPFVPRYFDSRVHGRLRIHYIDEGPRDAENTILLTHGEPSWCYLYRHMIPRFVQAGFRVLAMDLVGFGRSDKPAAREDYSYERQVDWMTEWLIHTEAHNITPFFQDWGGLIGLRVVARMPERFARLVISNTGVPTGGGVATQAFRVWASVMSQKIPKWSTILQTGCDCTLDEDELAAYDAPYPDESFKAATRVYPQLVPQFDEHMSVEENKGAWKRVFSNFRRPCLTLFASNDAVSRDGEKIWQELCPGAKIPGIPHQLLDGGHFIQEDQGGRICEIMIKFISDFPASPIAKL